MKKISTTPECLLLLVMSAIGLTSLPSETAAGSRQKATYRPTGHEGVITGTITIAGPEPTPKAISMAADAFCEHVNPGAVAEDLVVSGGRLANVLIHVKGEALEGYAFETLAPAVVFERKGCQMAPHVFGVQTGQVLRIVNYEGTAHNTQVRLLRNPELNLTQQPGAVPDERRFEQPESPIRITDEQHPWERAYIGIFPHPFFAVSGRDGSYSIQGLPPGQYTVEAWHEKLGTKTVEVSVGAKGSERLDLAFAVDAYEIPASDLPRGIPADLTLDGGVLDGKAFSKPEAIYPRRARVAGVTGTVTVEILVNESGNVSQSRAVSGPQPLRQMAVGAALRAKFPRTLVSGKPVKVRGVLTYSFWSPRK
jgi:TonB family protein